MLNKILLLLVLYLASAWAGSNTTIKGKILNSSGTPIRNAQVQIWSKGLAAISDSSGVFVLAAIKPGVYRLKVTHIAYQIKFIDELNISAKSLLEIPAIILTTKIFNADETLITATRKAQKPFDLPQALNLISQERIQSRHVSTSAEALREETGLHIQKTNHGGGSATIRGFNANRILILVDGFRMNNSLFRMGNHQYLTSIDHAALERIEVVRGPASGMYGSDALGGTIQLQTSKPDFTDHSTEWKFSVSGQSASADGQLLGHAAITHSTPTDVLVGSFAYKKFGDLHRGAYSLYPELEHSTRGLRQYPSAYSGSDYLLKGIHKLSDDKQIIYAYQASRQWNVPRYDKYETEDYRLWEYEPQYRQMGYLNFEWRPNSPFISYIKSGLSLQKQQEGRIIQKTEQDAVTTEEDAALKLGWILQARSFWRGHDFNYGLDIYGDAISSSRFRTTVDGRDQTIYEIPRFPDGAKYQSLGFFVQDEKRVLSKTRMLTSLRYNHYQTSFQSADNYKNMELFFNAFSANLRLVQELSQKFHLNFNLAQAYRAPNLSDLARFGQSKGDIFEVPNTKLKPEQLINMEIGFKYQSDRISSSASIYSAYVFDMIERADALYNGSPSIERDGTIMDVKSRQNLGNAIISGIEYHLEYRFTEDCRIDWNLSYTFGQNFYLDQPVSSIPPLFGLVGMEGKKAKFNYRFYLRFASAQRRLSGNDEDDPRIPTEGTPSWYTFNFRLGYDLNSAFNARFSLENILDFNYREHGSGINAAGRNFIFSLTYNF